MTSRESREKNIHSSIVTVFIDEVMKECGLSYRDLDAVVVSKGPGSYTGLRIGVSTAKGICYALDKPLIAINTLEAMAAGMLKGTPSLPVILCPMIDARRMEVYNALFDTDLNCVRETKAEIIDENSFSEMLTDHILVLAGDGAEKCKALLGNHPNVRFIDDFFPSAINMVLPAEKKFQAAAFEDIAYFEPFYLKDFIPGIPKIKGLL
jgi:tRNA threonylcarbamoyladenosine biosynthesis protein TsaB